MRRFGRLAVAVAVAAVLLVGGPLPRAVACSCLAPRSATDGIGGADAAFVGTFLGADSLPPPPAGEVAVLSGRPTFHHFSVERVVKGELGPRVSVWAGTDGASCGLSTRPGSRVGLLLRRDGDRWTAGLCNQRDAAALVASPAPGGVDGALVTAGAVGLLAGTAVLSRRSSRAAGSAASVG